MAITRVFKSGNSQAVRIPAEMAYEEGVTELTISRSGDVIVMHPKRPSMEQTIAELRALPRVPIVEIERTQTRETDWDR